MFVWTVAQHYCTCNNTSGCYVTLFLQTRETYKHTRQGNLKISVIYCWY